MTPRHRLKKARTGSAVRRAVTTSVLSALALTSVTITTAAVTLTNSPQRHLASAAAPPSTAATSVDADASLAPPVAVEDVRVGIPDIVLVAADGPRLDEIPTPAAAAYQRAAAVLGKADKSCHLDWTLVAAIGQVVTGHGSTSGSELDLKGVMRPQLAGKPLKNDDGLRIPDSDAGRLDGDGRYDRPVGPMQLAPSTWAVVGVDSDGDGRRNPHDIDDASLAVAVLLCSGEGDLRKRPGRVEAVRRVNDSRSFVETVLAVDRAYRYQLAHADDVTTVALPGDVAPFPTDLPTAVATARAEHPSADPSTSPSDPITWAPTDPDDTDPTDHPTDDPTDDPTDHPTDDPTDDPCATTDPVVTETPDAADPTDAATDAATDTPTDAATDEPTVTPTDDLTDVPSDLPTDDPSDDPCATASAD